MNDASKGNAAKRYWIPLLVLILMLSVVSSGCTSPVKDALEPIKEIMSFEKAPENTTQVLPVFEEANIKKLKVNITDMWVNTEYTYTQGTKQGAFSASTGYKYLFIKVCVRDERGTIEAFTAPRTFGTQAFTVGDNRGMVYDAAMLYVAEGAMPMLYNLQRGETMNGTIMFKVPEQGVITNITYADLIYNKLSAVWVVNKSISEFAQAERAEQ
ncbi:MAG: hypothetical protein ACXQT1_03380 [Methermicoccaceae archaeon]